MATAYHLRIEKNPRSQSITFAQFQQVVVNLSGGMIYREAEEIVPGTLVRLPSDWFTCSSVVMQETREQRAYVQRKS